MAKSRVILSQRSELVEDFCDIAVIHVAAHTICDFTNDFPIESCLSGRVENLSSQLHATVSVGVRSCFLKEGTRRENDICELCSFR